MTEPTDRPGSTGSDFTGSGGPEAGFAPGDPRVESALTQIRVIAGALAASVAVYGVIAWVVTGGATESAGEAIGLALPIVAVLVGMAIMDLLVAPLIERWLVGGAVGQPLERVLAEYRKAKIIGFAFREAAAVLGLMVALFTGDPAWCYGLSAATLVAMALAWPSREGLERVARGAIQPE